jgi:MPBQ/MSBQ methyltransferase
MRVHPVLSSSRRGVINRKASRGVDPTHLVQSIGPLSHRFAPRRGSVITWTTSSSSSSSFPSPTSSSSQQPPRFIQHKNEAKAFYAFLAQVYDYIVNPGHWTTEMRDEALVPADLSSPTLSVVDVGGGTGFCTQGIVKHVSPSNVTLLDQSPHQLSKAKKKADLKGVTIIEGDAEDLPFETDSFDRYVSAGSIEYWPDPQRGICEAYRVLKPNGKACLIGPVHPTHWLSRFMADAWMLFPTEEEYVEWFTKAGFEDVQVLRIGPKWYRGVRRHGLIMGCSVSGVKRAAGESPCELLPLGEVGEKSAELNANLLTVIGRLVLGTLAGFYYFVLPIYMYLKNLVWPKTGKLAQHF